MFTPIKLCECILKSVKNVRKFVFFVILFSYFRSQRGQKNIIFFPYSMRKSKKQEKFSKDRESYKQLLS